MAAPGSAPLPLIDDVAAESAELVIAIKPHNPSPASGSTVDWTVTLSNRTGFDAEFPSMSLSVGEGLVFEDTISAPSGWQAWTDGTGLSAWSEGVVLAAGETVTLVATTTVTGSSNSRLDIWANGSANNVWWESPRPGPWNSSWVTIDGVGLGGTVASQSGSPLVDVCVNVSSNQGGEWWGVRTGIDGSWSMSLPTGDDYRVQFDPKCQADWDSEFVTTYARQWWPGASAPQGEQPVALLSTTNLGQVKLLQGGAMLGQVTVPDGWDVEAVNVTVEDPDSGWWVDGTTVGSSGSWTISGLPPGEYRVAFRAQGLAEQYYEDTTRNAAYPVPVVAGTMTTGIDAAMMPGAVVTGVVTSGAAGDPIENVNVQVVDTNFNWFGGASTDSNGTYEITDLPSGSYLVVFEHQGYVRSFHDGSFDPENVEPLQISAGTSTTVDIAMVTGVTVSGAVTAAAGAHGLDAGDPIENVAVLAWPGEVAFSGQPVGLALTGPDGSYTLTNLPPIGVGLLFVHGIDFEGGGDIDPYWAASFWPGVGDFTLSTPLDLSAGADVTGIDAALMPAPVITGSVVDAHGGLLQDATPLDGMVVALFGIPGGAPIATTMTDESGNYQMRSILADMGVYLAAADMANAHNGAYAPMWFRNAPLDIGSSEPPDPVADGATPVVIKGGGTREVILAYNPPAAPAAPTGLGVAPGNGALALSWDAPDGPVESQTVVVDGVVTAELAADAGSYAIGGLTNGQTYDVEVFATNLGGNSAPATGSGAPTAPSTPTTTTPTTVPSTTTTTVAPTATTSAPATTSTTAPAGGGGTTTTAAATTSTSADSTTTTVSERATTTSEPDRPTNDGVVQPSPEAAPGETPTQAADGMGWVWLGIGAVLVSSAAWAVRFFLQRPS